MRTAGYTAAQATIVYLLLQTLRHGAYVGILQGGSNLGECQPVPLVHSILSFPQSHEDRSLVCVVVSQARSWRCC